MPRLEAAQAADLEPDPRDTGDSVRLGLVLEDRQEPLRHRHLMHTRLPAASFCAELRVPIPPTVVLRHFVRFKLSAGRQRLARQSATSPNQGSKGKLKERTPRMLAHLPANSLMASSPTLAWIGALVLIVGETAALMSLPNVVRVFVISTVAELGYVLIGFGVGGPAGDTGALMHLGFQIVMRGLVLAAGWSLVRRMGSAKLDDLAGSGRRMPLTATLFGFGVFSVMGLSPFKGSFSKFIILYAAIERGLWPVALDRHARDHRRRRLLHARRPARLPRAQGPRRRARARLAARRWPSPGRSPR